MSDTSNAAIVALAKTQILADIDAGMIPPCVSSFTELHDYVDANTYGDPLIAEREKSGEPWLSIVNPIVSVLNEWLEAGRPESPEPTPPAAVREIVREASTDLMEARASYHRAVVLEDEDLRLDALRRVLHAERVLLPMQRAL